MILLSFHERPPMSSHPPPRLERPIRLHRFAPSGHCQRVEQVHADSALAPEGGIELDEYPALRAWLARSEAVPRFEPMPRSL